ncbi:MAG: hypothetical protein J6X10_03905 [Bacteroidales bacterium]|nr:hypothetical protein [Bacteroidales bacterium]
MKSNGNYDWKFSTVGGVTRVNIESGQDILHLDELDRKLWTALSCPLKDLEIDEKTMTMLDTNGDGKIHIEEVVAASKWLTSVINDPELLLKRSSVLPFTAFNTSNEEGLHLLETSKQILENLGLEKNEISVADVSDSLAIFAKTRFNGDGIITEQSSDDEDIKALIKSIIDCMGGVTDRSGDPGIDTDKIEAFYTALAGFKAWKEAGDADKANVFPYGDDTAAALAACMAVKDKVEDFFMRCKLASFNADSAAVLDVSSAKIGEISNNNLAASTDEIATYPLAGVNAEHRLPLGNEVNPAWAGAMAALKALVIDKEYPKAEYITEEQWVSMLAKFDAYNAWMGTKAGAVVEGLGYDAVVKTLEENKKEALLDLVAQDKALESKSNAIDQVDKLLHYFRDFYTLLTNFVTFSDFYSPERKAIFQAGTLYIDERACDLCVKVNDMGAQGAMAPLSNMYILYCDCTCKSKPGTMTIAAVVTDGDVGAIMVGKHAVFYDRDGLGWNATVTKIVENPISIRQAFWSPYRKMAKAVEDMINKRAAEKDAKVMADANSKIESANVPTEKPAEAPKPPFDIAKFAGIFAAIGLAIGLVASALGGLFSWLGLHWYNVVIFFLIIILIISGPSMIMAWLKLRKRNLTPILNANGWALNQRLLVNTKFGATLTGIAKYPVVKTKDPFTMKTPWYKKLLRWFIFLVLLAVAVYFILPKNMRPWWPKEEPVAEQVEQVEAPAEAPAE